MNNISLVSTGELVRAQAQENFEFFCNSVCGLRVSSELCEVLQRAILHGERVESLHAVRELEPQRLRDQILLAVRGWEFVLGRRADVPQGLGETFSWLFGVEVAA